MKKVKFIKEKITITEKVKPMSDFDFYTKTKEGREMLANFKEKEARLLTWVNKLNQEELEEYKAGMSDSRRYFLRKKYNY